MSVSVGVADCVGGLTNAGMLALSQQSSGLLPQQAGREALGLPTLTPRWPLSGGCCPPAEEEWVQAKHAGAGEPGRWRAPGKTPALGGQALLGDKGKACRFRLSLEPGAMPPT